MLNNKFLLSLSFIIGLLFSSVTFAAEFEEGVHYKTFETPPKMLENTVLEFYWIACPHCKKLEPILTEWEESEKPENVELIQVPSNMGQWSVYAKLEYALMSTGKYDKEMKKDLFEFFSNPGDNDLNSWLSERELSQESIQESLKNDKEIKNIVSRDYFLNKHYSKEIKGVPFIIVNGSYIINTNKMDYRDVPDLINYLLTLEPKEFKDIE